MKKQVLIIFLNSVIILGCAGVFFNLLSVSKTVPEPALKFIASLGSPDYLADY